MRRSVESWSERNWMWFRVVAPFMMTGSVVVLCGYLVYMGDQYWVSHKDHERDVADIRSDMEPLRELPVRVSNLERSRDDQTQSSRSLQRQVGDQGTDLRDVLIELRGLKSQMNEQDRGVQQRLQRIENKLDQQ